MMAIIDLQRRIAEVGRIRIGQQTDSVNGGTRPVKLATFRLTSADPKRIADAAELFGGTPQEWDAPAGRQWEVITTADSLAVVVPPSEMAFSQFYEKWSAGGCKRRCDGVTESIGDQPCVCDADARDCAIHTRLSVMLRDLPGLGVWRIDTSGYYAAVELGGAVQVIQAAAGRGVMLPAALRLEQRAVKRQTDDGPQTRRFAVPVLDIEISPAQLLAAAQSPERLLTSKPTDSAGFTPVPAALPEGPGQSIAEQSAPPPPRAPRRDAAAEIPRSGRQRNTAFASPPFGEAGDDPVPGLRERILAATSVDDLRTLWNEARDNYILDAATGDWKGHATTIRDLISNRHKYLGFENSDTIAAWFEEQKIPAGAMLSHVAALAQRSDLPSLDALTLDEASVVMALLTGFADTDDPLSALQEATAEWYDRKDGDDGR